MRWSHRETSPYEQPNWWLVHTNTKLLILITDTQLWPMGVSSNVHSVQWALKYNLQSITKRSSLNWVSPMFDRGWWTLIDKKLSAHIRCANVFEEWEEKRLKHTNTSIWWSYRYLQCLVVVFLHSLPPTRQEI